MPATRVIVALAQWAQHIHVNRVGSITVGCARMTMSVDGTLRDTIILHMAKMIHANQPNHLHTFVTRSVRTVELVARV